MATYLASRRGHRLSYFQCCTLAPPIPTSAPQTRSKLCTIQHDLPRTYVLTYVPPTHAFQSPRFVPPKGMIDQRRTMANSQFAFTVAYRDTSSATAICRISVTSSHRPPPIQSHTNKGYTSSFFDSRKPRSLHFLEKGNATWSLWGANALPLPLVSSGE